MPAPTNAVILSGGGRAVCATYTLTIHANDLNDPNVEGPIVAHSYKTTTLTVIIAEHDVTLNDVMLTPLKPGEKDEDIPF